MSEEQIIMEEFEQILGGLEGIDSEMILTFVGIMGAVALVIGLISIVCYVLQSIGLYTIAKRRGIRNPWLAWLPVGNYWIAGSIADQYQYVTSGAVKNKRKILLALSIAGIVVSSLAATMTTGTFMIAYGEVATEDLIGLGALGTVLDLVISALEIATLVFWHWSLYELYSSCKPGSNMLFLILGIFLPFLVAFFVFACRNKEEGMPPRRDEPQYQSAPPQPEPQPQAAPRTYKDPWEN